MIIGYARVSTLDQNLDRQITNFRQQAANASIKRKSLALAANDQSWIV